MKDMNHGGKRRHHHDGPDQHDHGYVPRERRRGFGPPFGPPDFGPRRGPRGGRNRGDVRAAILLLLAEQPRHGYDLMRAIEERSNGLWTPSPGSIYPTLQSLEDEGLVAFETVDGRKTARLTDAGNAWVEEHPSEAEAVFNREGANKTELIALREEVHGLHDAVMAVGRTRDASVATKAAEILAQARKDLYALLSA